MTVPYSFATATAAIPLSQLDSNFNTAITLGNTAIQLGNTVTTLNNMTLNNVSILSGNVTITNVSVTTANVTTLNATTVLATTANVTTANITTDNVTFANITGENVTTSNVTTLTLTNNPTLNGGTANGVLYLNGSKVATSGSALTFDGTTLGTNRFSMTGYLATFNNDNFYMEFQRSGTPFGYIGTGSNTAGGAVTDLGIRAQNNLVFAANATEQMRLTSTGLGVGTSSPGYKLDVNGAIRASGDGSSVGLYLTTSAIRQNTTGGLYIDANASGAAGGIYFRDSSSFTTRLTIDSSGNLGLGVTPSAWDTALKAIQVNTQGVFASETNAVHVMTNVYYNSGYKYIGTGYATDYYQYLGAHVWRTASSGSAGGTISWTQAMTLDASGNVGIGTSSPSTALDVASSNSGITLTNTAVSNKKWRLGGNAAGSFLITESGAADRLWLDTSGNLGLGVTPSAWGSGVKAIDVGSYTSLLDLSANSAIYNNAYYDGANVRYRNSGAPASYYNQVSSKHIWGIAASGTAGAAISFTQAMTLHASGGLSLGNTSDPGATNLSVTGTAKAGIVHLGGNYTAGATTPSVTGISYMPISNSSATTITNFTGAVTGQIIYLYFADANTTITRANARLAGSTNFTSTQYATLALLYNGTEWIEICRSTTNG